MGENMDRRQKKTRKAIIDSFSNLLKNNKYDDITVQDIIDNADICRSTFYMHFETKDMLLKELCSDVFEHIFSGNICEYHQESDTIEAKLSHILWHLKTHNANILKILTTNHNEILISFLKEYLYKLFELHINEFNKNVPKDFLINHLIGSFTEAILWWSKNDSNISPETISNYFMNTIETH